MYHGWDVCGLQEVGACDLDFHAHVGSVCADALSTPDCHVLNLSLTYSGRCCVLAVHKGHRLEVLRSHATLNSVCLSVMYKMTAVVISSVYLACIAHSDLAYQVACDAVQEEQTKIPANLTSPGDHPNSHYYTRDHPNSHYCSRDHPNSHYYNRDHPNSHYCGRDHIIQ